MPWTGGAFLVGAMAIAGLPPLNGFASEWLVLQSLLHVALREPLGVALAAGTALAGLAATAALALLCFVKVVGLVLLGAAASTRVRAGRATRRWGCVPAMAVLAALVRRCSASSPASSLPTLAGLAPGAHGAAWRAAVGLHRARAPAPSDAGLALAIGRSR